MSDGQYRKEKGMLKKVGQKSIMSVTGEYTFIGTDLKIYKVTYTADENGYKPKIHISQSKIGK